MSVDILFAKTYLVLVVCLVVRNNSCSKFWSSQFFLLNLNIAHALFYTADFNLLNCVFVVSLNFNFISLIFYKIVKTNICSITIITNFLQVYNEFYLFNCFKFRFKFLSWIVCKKNIISIIIIVNIIFITY